MFQRKGYNGCVMQIISVTLMINTCRYILIMTSYNYYYWMGNTTVHCKNISSSACYSEYVSVSVPIT